MLSFIKLVKRIPLVLITLIPFISFCQPLKRCGTHEYWEMMKLKDASLSTAEEKVRNDANSWIASNSSMRSASAVIVIPVVVHVLYHTSKENISDAQVISQIDALNDDFSKLNIDAFQIPAAWSSIAANTGIQFCLATLKPDSTPTNGIERAYTTKTAWEISELDSIKSTSYGGLDAWNRDHYLNIWVAHISSGVLGLTQLPGGPAASDGMVIQYTAFGRTGEVHEPYAKGRTTTHEAGHWLGLYHVWGDDNGACSGSDFINDTPNQANASYGCPVFPLTDNCTPDSPGVMFMNYMDYTDDACMHFFTQDQATLMNAVLNTTRFSLQQSHGCSGVITKEFIRVYHPGPGAIIQVRVSFEQPEALELTITDVLGRLVIHHFESPASQAIFDLYNDLSLSHLPNGIYILSLKSSTISQTQRISIQH